jgi:hypothetical protein
MVRTRHHHYRILSGALAGSTFLGQQIGFQEYPDQIAQEQMSPDAINELRQRQYSLDRCEGIWLHELNQAVYRPVPVTGKPPKVDILAEGVNYDGVYLDLCTPFDRFNNTIFVGDELYVSIRNEVRLAKVVRIADKPFMASYGIMNRKLTVRDEQEDQTLTINDPRSTVKKIT